MANLNLIRLKIQDFEALLTANHQKISPDFMEFLKKSKFFILPASVGHHNNRDCGLLDHSLAVAETLLVLTERNHLKWSRPESPVIIGLFHDLCKTEAYEEGPDGLSKPWVYAEPRNQLYTGHGEKSVLMLAPWFQLTPEEVACIRWHMGAFDEKDNWSLYTAAVRQFPNVLWTHQADMITAHILQR